VAPRLYFWVDMFSCKCLEFRTLLRKRLRNRISRIWVHVSATLLFDPRGNFNPALHGRVWVRHYLNLNLLLHSLPDLDLAFDNQYISTLSQLCILKGHVERRIEVKFLDLLVALVADSFPRLLLISFDLSLRALVSFTNISITRHISVLCLIAHRSNLHVEVCQRLSLVCVLFGLINFFEFRQGLSPCARLLLHFFSFLEMIPKRKP